MLKAVLCGASVLLAVLAAGPAQAQQSLATDVANLREDVRGLTQRMGDLQLRVEQLESENSRLRAGAGQNFATVAQLNEAVAEMNRTIRSACAATKNETLQHVSVQMEKLAEQTNSALESIARGSSRPAATAPATAFTDDYSKEGIKYVVQRGETIATIAKKTGASVRDIINANRIADPSRVQAGQTLFIPGGK